VGTARRFLICVQNMHVCLGLASHANRLDKGPDRLHSNNGGSESQRSVRQRYLALSPMDSPSTTLVTWRRFDLPVPLPPSTTFRRHFSRQWRGGNPIKLGLFASYRHLRVPDCPAFSLGTAVFFSQTSYPVILVGSERLKVRATTCPRKFSSGSNLLDEREARLEPNSLVRLVVSFGSLSVCMSGFSNRPFGVQALSTITTTCDGRSRARALFGIVTMAPSIIGFEDWVEQSFGRPSVQSNGRSKRTCDSPLHRPREGHLPPLGGTRLFSSGLILNVFMLLPGLLPAHRNSYHQPRCGA